jgi:1,5-anhydro-D-fructose reductase (1,5-anhydro-D-mannitol-forming)
MKREIIRWGILGCGDVTERKSGPALQKAAGSELVAVMRRDAGKAEDYSRRHGVPFWTNDAEELINRPDVDIVYIATPPGSHLELALRVCAAGKPCYVEKPMARSAVESMVMLEAFRRADLPLYVAFYRRGLDRFKITRELLKNGRLGELTGIAYTFQSPRQPYVNRSQLPWRLNAADAGAGLFYDLGSHLLDIFDFLLGPLEDVSGLAANFCPELDIEETVAMTFTATGAPAAARWNFAAFESRDEIELEGTHGKITLSCLGSDPVRLETRAGVEEFPSEQPPHIHQPLVQTIVDELRGIGKCPSTAETALRTMKVMDAVLDAYYGGRADEFWNRRNSWPGQRRDAIKASRWSA